MHLNGMQDRKLHPYRHVCYPSSLFVLLNLYYASLNWDVDLRKPPDTTAAAFAFNLPPVVASNSATSIQSKKQSALAVMESSAALLNDQASDGVEEIFSTVISLDQGFITSAITAAELGLEAVQAWKESTETAIEDVRESDEQRYSESIDLLDAFVSDVRLESIGEKKTSVKFSATDDLIGLYTCMDISR